MGNSIFVRRFLYLIVRDWRISLLIFLGIVLSLASGYTTWQGMTHFTGEQLLSLLVTIGIQGIMLVAAWQIGDSFAHGVSIRRTSQIIFGSILRQLSLWIMFLGTMSISVLFSFDALFSQNIFGIEARKEAGRVFARSEIESMMRVIEARIREQRLAEHSLFLEDQSWQNFEQRVLNVVNVARGARKILDDNFRQKQANRVKRLDKARRDLIKVEANLAKALEEEQALRIETARYISERAVLRMRVRRLDAEHKKIAAAAEEKKSQATHEASGTRGTKKEGRGPAYRRLMGEAVKLRQEAIIVHADLQRAKGNLKRLDGILRPRAERLKTLEGQLNALKGAIRGLRRRVKYAEGGLAGASPANAIGPLIDNLNRGLGLLKRGPGSLAAGSASPTFARKNPKATVLTEVSDVCSQLVAALQATENKKLRKSVNNLNCAVTAGAVRAGRVVQLNRALSEFVAGCRTLSRRLAGRSAKDLVNEGRNCLERSGLTGRHSAGLAQTLNRLRLEHTGNAHPFIVARNALFYYREPLAFLALAIAFAIDALIFVSAIIGTLGLRRRMDSLGDAGAAAGVRSVVGLNTNIGPHDTDPIRNAKTFLRYVRSSPREIESHVYMGYVSVDEIQSTIERERVLRIVNAGNTRVGRTQVVFLLVDDEKISRYYVVREFYEELARDVIQWNNIHPPPELRDGAASNENALTAAGRVGTGQKFADDEGMGAGAKAAR